MCIGGKRTTRQVISEVEIKTFATKAVIAAIPDGPAQDACHRQHGGPSWLGKVLPSIGSAGSLTGGR